MADDIDPMHIHALRHVSSWKVGGLIPGLTDPYLGSSCFAVVLGTSPFQVVVVCEYACFLGLVACNQMITMYQIDISLG